MSAKSRRRGWLAALSMCAAALVTLPAVAQEAVIRKALSERLPRFPKIDEVTKGPMGLYEVRAGSEIFYTDEGGNYLIQGFIVDTRQRVNLTQERIDKITAQLFNELPMSDLLVWKQGKGTRKVVVFSDPNCGYCRRLERDMQQLKDVTVFTVLYPVLGQDSLEKTKNVWCSKDRLKAWQGLMLEGAPPVRSFGGCDTSALDRNTALGQKYKVDATPTLIFENGKQITMALTREELEKQLAEASRTR